MLIQTKQHWTTLIPGDATWSCFSACGIVGSRPSCLTLYNGVLGQTGPYPPYPIAKCNESPLQIEILTG